MRMKTTLLLLGLGLLTFSGMPAAAVSSGDSEPLAVALGEVCPASPSTEAASALNPLSFSALDGAVLQDAGCCADALENCNQRCGPCGKLAFTCTPAQPPLVTCVGICQCRICKD